MDPSASRQRRNIDPLGEAEEHRKLEDGGLAGLQVLNFSFIVQYIDFFIIQIKSCICV